MRTWESSGETIDPKPVEWLWPSRIAKKKMNIVAGEGKQGENPDGARDRRANQRGRRVAGRERAGERRDRHYPECRG